MARAPTRTPARLIRLALPDLLSGILGVEHQTQPASSVSWKSSSFPASPASSEVLHIGSEQRRKTSSYSSIVGKRSG